MDFEIRGVERTSGKPRRLILSAADEVSARLESDQHGIDASSVRPLVAPARPSWTRSEHDAITVLFMLLLVAAVAGCYAFETIGDASKRYRNAKYDIEKSRMVGIFGNGDGIVSFTPSSDGVGEPIFTPLPGSFNSGERDSYVASATSIANTLFWKMILSYGSAIAAATFPITSLVIFLNLRKRRRLRATR